ncbi:MAG: Gfo/Idh/MocA family oxidoreductase, partial [Lachnospiraceae bacterium]|nr:Gfo/Idh/MocA family oxidoreductase [Lachnospiraceae bacterium]
MKLGIVGAGMIVREFLPELKKLSGVEVVALQGTQRSRERAEKLCAENKVAQVVYDFDALCETGIDTVYVAVPNALHFSCCREALLRGKNVIVEKPMASNEREAVMLERLAKERGLFLFEAITTLYLPALGKVREWLEKIGTLKIVQCQ